VRQIVDHPSWWPAIAQFVAERAGGAPRTEGFAAIGLVDSGKLIAGVVYSDFNGSNITAGIAGDGKSWMTREFLWFMFHYPFIQAGAKRITACVEQTNVVSQQFVTKLGFELEGVMERAGKTGDLLMYRMFPENCRYLERRHARCASQTRFSR
jgi:RimJ/RimL family protein N-acetyltransferase